MSISTDFPNMIVDATSIVHRVTGEFATSFTLVVGGDFGSGGVLAILGGNDDARERIRIFDPATGASFELDAIASSGMYSFKACCTVLEFALSGSTSPDLEVTLFQEPRA